MSSAQKHDVGKVMWHLFPPNSMEHVAKVFTFGAQKYGEYNYAAGGGLVHSRLYSAAQRHLQQHWAGCTIDEESGLPHLAHAVANLLMIMGSGVDDRPDWDALRHSEERR